MRPSHFDIFSLGVVLPFGSVWIKMSDSTLINEFLTQQKDFGWNAGGWLEKEKRPRLYLLHNPSKRHKLFIQWLFPVSLFISLSAPSETNQWTLRRRRRKKEKELWTSTCFSPLRIIFRLPVWNESRKRTKTVDRIFFHFPVEKQKCREFTNSTKKMKNKFGNWIVDSSKCLIEKEKGSIQLNSGELEDLTEWKIAPFHHVTAGPPTEPPLYYHYRIMYT